MNPWGVYKDAFPTSPPYYNIRKQASLNILGIRDQVCKFLFQGKTLPYQRPTRFEATRS
jgi:hypothetical protein